MYPLELALQLPLTLEPALSLGAARPNPNPNPNQVLLDTKDYVAQLPHSLAAFYYKETADAHSQVSAA